MTDSSIIQDARDVLAKLRAEASSKGQWAYDDLGGIRPHHRRSDRRRQRTDERMTADEQLDARIAEAEDEQLAIDHVEGWRFRCTNCGWLGPVEDYFLARLTGRLHTKECEA